MRISAIIRHRAGTTFVFIFFLIFLLCSLLLIPRITNVYEGIITRADNTQSESIVLEHLLGAVKRADNQNSISVTSLADSTPALAITKNNITWLYYCKDGYLYIQNSRKTELYAERLCEAGIMYLSQKDNMISVEYISQNNNVQTLILTPRSGIVGGAN